jgi:GT2 family glycosyltransferase
MAKCSVIIPVLNQAALTRQCLKAVLRGGTGEVIVVDDGSTDATPRLLASFGDAIKVVTHRANAGFAASCNDGTRVATGGYLVFLNNDTIPQPGWLEALSRYADTHPTAAAVGARLLYPNHTIQHAGVVIGQDRYPRHIYAGFPASHPAVSKSRRFQIVTAACVLVRRPVFELSDGFDVAYRNGFEDVDLCLRMGQRGYEVHYCAESVVVHLESMSPGRFKSDGHNAVLYRQRWLERVKPDDLAYYVEDGLLRFSYEGRYPIGMEVSPLLAAMDNAQRGAELECLLREQSRELAELQRENTRLSLELGAQAGDSNALRYRQLRQRIIDVVQKRVPAGSAVLVISKGDGAFLNLPGCQGWHFPQTDRGAYAGHHPATSAEAIRHLEWLRTRGGSHLLIPASSLWWLDHYPDFRQHLDQHYTRLAAPDDACVLYALADIDETPFKNASSKTAYDPCRTAVPT